MQIFICGNYAGNCKKPCKYCRYFLTPGTGCGYCLKRGVDVHCTDHCKYYKRNSKFWTKDGKCKINEFLLYM